MSTLQHACKTLQNPYVLKRCKNSGKRNVWWTPRRLFTKCAKRYVFRYFCNVVGVGIKLWPDVDILAKVFWKFDFDQIPEHRGGWYYAVYNFRMAVFELWLQCGGVLEFANSTNSRTPERTFTPYARSPGGRFLRGEYIGDLGDLIIWLWIYEVEVSHKSHTPALGGGGM